jgi:hypothetical protein
MVKLIRDLGPLAIGVALFGLLIAYLIGQGSNIGNWLLAAFLVGHGWVHVMYLVPRPEPQPATASGPDWAFELNRSWLLSGLGLSTPTLRALGIVLVVVTLVGYVLAAMASIPLLVPVAAWTALIVAATAASALLMAVFFSPMLLIGFGIDVVLLWIVLMRVWRPV